MTNLPLVSAFDELCSLIVAFASVPKYACVCVAIQYLPKNSWTIKKGHLWLNDSKSISSKVHGRMNPLRGWHFFPIIIVALASTSVDFPRSSLSNFGWFWQNNEFSSQRCYSCSHFLPSSSLTSIVITQSQLMTRDVFFCYYKHHLSTINFSFYLYN